MTLDAISLAKIPEQDTTAFLDDLRTAQISHLLVAAVIQYDVGSLLAEEALEFAELCDALELKLRPAIVLLTALRSIGLIDVNPLGKIELTAYGREKLDPSSPFHLRGYVGLGALSHDVQNMIACLREDKPSGNVSFVYHFGAPSALDDKATADLLTRAMADRARNVAPLLASQLSTSSATHVVDVGGGHGLYCFALLQANPALRATIIDRAPALAVAKEYAEAAGCSERVTLLCDDAHSASLSNSPDIVLLANLLHDYNESDARRLVQHYAGQLAPGGRLMVLDSLLNSTADGMPPISDGPRAVAAYSAMLFSICEGRCYRLDEIQSWLASSELDVDETVLTLPAHGSLVIGIKPH